MTEDEIRRSQVAFFGTTEGSCFFVIARESIDSKTILTDYETELTISHFGEQQLHRAPLSDSFSSKFKRICIDSRRAPNTLVF